MGREGGREKERVIEIKRERERDEGGREGKRESTIYKIPIKCMSMTTRLFTI